MTYDPNTVKCAIESPLVQLPLPIKALQNTLFIFILQLSHPLQGQKCSYNHCDSIACFPIFARPWADDVAIPAPVAVDWNCLSSAAAAAMKSLHPNDCGLTRPPAVSRDELVGAPRALGGGARRQTAQHLRRVSTDIRVRCAQA